MLTRGKKAAAQGSATVVVQGAVSLRGKDDERSAAKLAKHLAKSVRAGYVSSTRPVKIPWLNPSRPQHPRASSMAFAIRLNRSILTRATARDDASPNGLA